jgi:hypothetical protein
MKSVCRPHTTHRRDARRVAVEVRRCLGCLARGAGYAARNIARRISWAWFSGSASPDSRGNSSLDPGGLTHPVL